MQRILGEEKLSLDSKLIENPSTYRCLGNKGPSKPRAKKTQIHETSVEETPVYEPSSPKRNLKMPTEPNSSDIAAAMLKLLQDQAYTRQARKQRLYQSWFQ